MPKNSSQPNRRASSARSGGSGRPARPAGGGQGSGVGRAAVLAPRWAQAAVAPEVLLAAVNRRHRGRRDTPPRQARRHQDRDRFRSAGAGAEPEPVAAGQPLRHAVAAPGKSAGQTGRPRSASPRPGTGTGTGTDRPRSGAGRAGAPRWPPAGRAHRGPAPPAAAPTTSGPGRQATDRAGTPRGAATAAPQGGGLGQRRPAWGPPGQAARRRGARLGRLRRAERRRGAPKPKPAAQWTRDDGAHEWEDDDAPRRKRRGTAAAPDCRDERHHGRGHRVARAQAPPATRDRHRHPQCRRHRHGPPPRAPGR